MLEATVQMILESLVRMPSYGLWWLVFVGLVFSAARFTLWPFVYLAFVLVICLVYHLEVTTPTVNLSAEPDFFSMQMVIIRMVIVCAILAPVAVLGYSLKKRNFK